MINLVMYFFIELETNSVIEINYHFNNWYHD